MSTQAETSPVKAESALSLLEKTVQLRFALMVLSGVFAVDIGVSCYRGIPLGVFEWAGSGFPFGAVLVFGGAFVYFMAVLSPGLLATIEYLFSAFNLARSAVHYDLEVQYRRGLVRLLDAKIRALAEKDDFWIKRVEEELARYEHEEEEAELGARIAFACTLLFVIDGIFVGPASLVREVVRMFAQLDRYLSVGALAMLACFCMMLVAWSWISWLRRERHPIRWIEHPEFAAERYQEIKKRKDELSSYRGNPATHYPEN